MLTQLRYILPATLLVALGTVGCDSLRQSFSGSPADDSSKITPVAYKDKKKGKKVEYTKTASGLQYRIIKSKEGGKKPTAKNTVTVHYEGWLDDGTVFDSSYKRGEPISFPLSGVIKGWTEGVQYMGIGETIELIIPSDLGYGDRGAPPTIPGKATLHFKIELLEIK